MPLIYDFNFANEYAGQDATVTDAAGSEVSGSPVTLDATGDASLSLSEGVYQATVSNTALGLNNAQTVGVLNVAASIAAGGGGAPFDPQNALVFAATTPFALTETYNLIDCDTVPDGYTPGTGFEDLPDGLYLVNIEIDFTEPAEQRYVAIAIQGSAYTTDSHGPYVITPGTTDSSSWTIYATVPFARVGAAHSLTMTLIPSVASDAVSPDDLEVVYAGFAFTKIP